jgi:hypothetical protein
MIWQAGLVGITQARLAVRDRYCMAYLLLAQALTIVITGRLTGEKEPSGFKQGMMHL